MRSIVLHNPHEPQNMIVLVFFVVWAFTLLLVKVEVRVFLCFSHCIKFIALLHFVKLIIQW